MIDVLCSQNAATSLGADSLARSGVLPQGAGKNAGKSTLRQSGQKRAGQPIAIGAASTSKPTMLSSWQQQLANLITDAEALCAYLQLDVQQFAQVYRLPAAFPLRVTHVFADKMRKGDLHDPLLKQILPAADEFDNYAGFSADPLAEQQHNPTRGLLHKYQSRVLITLTGACAVHCRYCFRRHFNYAENMPTSQDLQRVLDYIRSDSQINEVLFSGGDPLNVSNRRLRMWFEALEASSIRTIRLHTRLPVVLPDRIDDELLEIFARSSKAQVMVVHSNHPNELAGDTAAAFARLKSTGIVLLNQSVLLKGVNDRAAVLAQLSERLFAQGVLPYYLHMLDKVQGAGHFLVEEQQAVALYWQLLAQLPGYLMPKLVQELPSKPYKTPVDVYQNFTQNQSVARY